jgi:hypothetical protein
MSKAAHVSCRALIGVLEADVRVTNPRFIVWVSAFEAGLLTLKRVIQWADGEIARWEGPPPMWLIRLSLLRDETEFYRLARDLAEGDEGWSNDWDEVHVGCMYLAYEAGLTSMAWLLQQAGEYADAPGCGEPCESFYLLLNEIDGGGPTVPSDRPLEERARELFEPFARKARRALKDFPLP